MSEEKFILPKEVRKAVAKNPGTMILFSVPKAGKTTIVAQLPNSLLIELEPSGADFVDANVLNISNPIEFDKALKAIVEAGCPYDYVVIDSGTKLDEWSEYIGTLNYMGKSMGKRFNVDPVTGEKYKMGSPKFETVHQLADGNGYKFSRDQMIKWYDMMSKVAKHVIILAHVKDKFIESKKSGDTVETKDIDLTGKVKGIWCSNADAVGHFFRRGNEGVINFNNENSIACGGRCPHLDGEIVISEKNEDKSITTFWDKIYLK